MIFIVLMFLFFFIICGFMVWDIIVLDKPKKLYRIDYGYLIPSDFTLIRAKTVDKAVKKFKKKYPTARIYSIERVEEF